MKKDSLVFFPYSVPWLSSAHTGNTARRAIARTITGTDKSLMVSPMVFEEGCGP
jgi:hypothetical protein